MAKSSDPIIHNTLTELALMLVFVFALIPAIALSTSPGEANSASGGAKRAGDSCLWIAHPNHPTEIGNVISIIKTDSPWLKDSNLMTERRVTEDHEQGVKYVKYVPIPRSFLQIYWLNYDEDHSHPERSGAAFAVEFNLDAGRKPYVFRDNRARRAVRDAMRQLEDWTVGNSTVFVMPRQSVNQTTEVFRKERVIERYAEPIEVAKELSRILRYIEETYECRLLIDFYNFPDGEDFDKYISDTTLFDDDYRRQVEIFQRGMGRFYYRTANDDDDWIFAGTRRPFPLDEDNTD